MTGPVLEASPRRGPRASVGSKVWFVWMIVMWVAFFVLLAAGRLDGVWDTVRDLHIVLEVVLWVLFLPWLLGTAVWNSSWAEWLRVALVVCFAVGWTVLSVPRAKKRKRSAI